MIRHSAMMCVCPPPTPCLASCGLRSRACAVPAAGICNCTRPVVANNCCQQLLPTIVADNCCRQLLPTTVANNCGRQLLPTTVADNCCRQLLPTTVADNCCRQLLPTTVGDNFCRQLLPTTVADNCGRQLWPTTVADNCCPMPSLHTCVLHQQQCAHSSTGQGRVIGGHWSMIGYSSVENMIK